MQRTNALLALIEEARDRNASDLILAAGSPPSVYRDGVMQPLTNQPLTAEELDRLILSSLNEQQRERLLDDRDLDFSMGQAKVGRVRINVHYQRKSLAAAVRLVPDDIPELSTLNLPDVVERLVNYPRGLVLVTGGTGEGKSTTLAAMVDRINHAQAKHVITLEDPIEYAFRNAQCIIEQREIGDDAPTFASALRHVVRQKPDVILIGEMRDLETISTALTAAETGHLVLASLHTVSAAQTIERIVDVFDPRQQPQIRLQLANTLRAIVCQTLMRNERDGGMLPACEVMVNTPAISRAIRENNIHLIPGMIETGANLEMQTLDSAIAKLVHSGAVSEAAAASKAANPDTLLKMLKRTPPKAEPVVTAGAGRKPWE